MHTPYGRDIVKQVAEPATAATCRSASYSVVDWHYPNYPNQGRHHELPPQFGDRPDYPKYIEFFKAQVRELCSNYGEIHGFWWDMNVEKTVDRSIDADPAAPA